MKIRELVDVLLKLDQGEEATIELVRESIPRLDHRIDPPTHTDLRQMLKDIRALVKANPGATVAPADNPASRQIGFAVTPVDGINTFFTIGIQRVKAAGNHRLTADPVGRRILCEFLAAGETLGSLETSPVFDG